MYKQKISISINSKFNKDQIFNEFDSLLGSLWKTGQIEGPFETPYYIKNEIASFQTTPERTSLSKKYNDKYVTLKISNLENWCNSKLKTEVFGKSFPYYGGTCRCKKNKFLILFTNAFKNSSPVLCGFCNESIPIYKIRNLIYDDRYDIYNWQGEYRAIDELQLGSNGSEKWSTKQMSDPDSQLSQFGRNICSRIQEITGIPVYYYLFNYKKITQSRDKLRKCPSCNGNWLIPKPHLNFYSFKCKKCMLVSSLTTNF